MDRRWFAGLVGIALAGCASPGDGSPRRGVPRSEGSPFDDLASIHQTINNGTRPVPATAEAPSAAPAIAAGAGVGAEKDSNTARASTVPPEPEPKLLDIPGLGARPAPFAGAAEPAPRPQAAPDPRSNGRAAPYAETEPSRPRPQAAPISLPEPRPTQAAAEPSPDSAPAPVAVSLPGPGPFDAPPPSPAPLPDAPPPLAENTPPILPSTSDPAVVAASAPAPAPPPTFSTPPSPPPLLEAPKPKRSEMDIVGRPAARVGDEIITLHQLRAAVREKVEMIPAQERTPDVLRIVTDRVLENLIDRALILQAAKRQLKDPRQLDSFHEAIEKVWLEHEVPPLLKVHNAKNVYELKEKLSAKGKSYTELRDEFRRNTLAQEFLQLKMKDKLAVSLPEMWSYYDKHKKEYDRPAQYVWREIVIDLAKNPTRAEAKRKADAILARLRRGEDFAKIAEKESDGATRSYGGRWETAPNSYGVESVNAFLEKMPINQISPVIEAPAAFHIVRVEQRRAAGPARFDEVQDQVKQAVTDEKRKEATSKYVAGLRERAIVTTMFDPPPSDPAAIKTGASKPISRK